MAQPAGTIFDIKRSAVHDGPGIRTTIFLKGCSLRCLWCHSPESQDPEPEVMYSPALCTHCGDCARACPAGLLSRGPAELDRGRCQACGRCVAACIRGAREMVGRRTTVSEVMAIVERDRVLYAASGGGVTLSGGEPALQPEFAAAVLQEARALGLHTALQTAGHVSWRALESLLHHTDLVMYDLKHALAPRHQALTGAGNRTILDNLERLAGLAGMEPCRNGAGAHRPPAHQAVKFIVRIPVVPGCNDAPDEMAGLAGLLADLPSSPERVELLPYHNLGVPKYQGLGRTYALPEVRPPSSTAALAGLAGLFSSYGLRAVVEGAGFDEP